MPRRWLGLAAATASADRPSRANRIVFDDCRDGELVRDYGRNRLVRARRDLTERLRERTPCLEVLARAIRRAGDVEVYKGCFAGRTERRQAFASLESRRLRRALRRMPSDVRQYSDCDRFIRAALKRRKA